MIILYLGTSLWSFSKVLLSKRTAMLDFSLTLPFDHCWGDASDKKQYVDTGVHGLHVSRGLHFRLNPIPPRRHLRLSRTGQWKEDLPSHVARFP